MGLSRFRLQFATPESHIRACACLSQTIRVLPDPTRLLDSKV
jgi:hypothetical protein